MDELKERIRFECYSVDFDCEFARAILIRYLRAVLESDCSRGLRNFVFRIFIAIREKDRESFYNALH